MTLDVMPVTGGFHVVAAEMLIAFNSHNSSSEWVRSSTYRQYDCKAQASRGHASKGSFPICGGGTFLPAAAYMSHAVKRV